MFSHKEWLTWPLATAFNDDWEREWGEVVGRWNQTKVRCHSYLPVPFPFVMRAVWQGLLS